jgi:hypothetical protein
LNILRKLADNRNRGSLAARARLRRFELFGELLQEVPKPVRILDVGGTQEFWEVMGFTDRPGVQITLLNLTPPQVTHSDFEGVVGDATNMSCFQQYEFDVVFSNSVIEHVGTHEDQELMAQEIRRVGKRYFVQTPNYFFPIEPHFLFLGFHWLPIPVRAFLVSRFDLGWCSKVPDSDRAREVVEGIRLLKKKEMLALFPGADLYQERLLGLVKSFVVYSGW